MVAIEHRSKSANTTASILSPTSNTSANSASTSAASTTLSTISNATVSTQKKMSSSSENITSAAKSVVDKGAANEKVHKEKVPKEKVPKEKVHKEKVEKEKVPKDKVEKEKVAVTPKDPGTHDSSKKALKLDLSKKEGEGHSIKSPRSPNIGHLPHQTSLTASVDVEDRKTLREALYQGIFHRHRRTIFAVGSFLRMFRNRNNTQYNTIRSSSEGEGGEVVNEVR